MKKPILLLATLSIIGAGALGYWQFSKSQQATDDAARAKATQSELPKAATRTNHPNDSGHPKAPKSLLIAKITDTSIRWEIRVDILRRLDADSLTGEEIDSLYSLLTHTPKPGQEGSWWVTVNEIMEQMRKQGIGADRYTPVMLSIIRDSDAPEVLRDYAVQHLGQWVTPRGAEQGVLSEPSPQLVHETAETLGKIITDATLAHTSIPGTTLMVIADMKSGGVPEATLAPVIDSLQPWFTSTISGKNDLPKITRISAINAVSILGIEEHAPAIRQLAESDTTDASIRLNSIAALGNIGTASDLTTLQAIATSTARYRYAAKAAYKKLTIKNKTAEHTEATEL